MSYRDSTTSLADDVRDSVVALWGRLDADQITRAEFVELAAVVIARGNRRATSLADVALAATLSVQLGRAVAPLGIDPADDLDRLRQATATVAESDTADRAARLARAEPLEAAARTYSAGIAASRYVTGWTRQTSPDACPVCLAWAAGGPFLDTLTMATHPGCSCIPVPTTRR